LKAVSAILLVIGVLIADAAAQDSQSRTPQFFTDAHPGSPEFWFAKGYQQQQQGNYDQAIAAYTEALSMNPGYAAAYNNRGIAYRNKGHNDRAIADFTKLLEIDPGDSSGYYYRGYSYFQNGLIDRARADLEQAAKLNRDLLSQHRARAKGDEVRYLELLQGK
jgi:tetratricopeptide (TPR) repeat protein